MTHPGMDVLLWVAAVLIGAAIGTPIGIWVATKIADRLWP